VVSGPGYIRRLFDKDADGVYDSAESVVKVRGIAQGLLFDGSDFWYTADRSLTKVTFRDDSTSERRTITFLTTDAEHGAHAIRKGPDGWFYVLCGNATEIRPEFYSRATSPVKKPRAGFLMRFPPPTDSDTPASFSAEIVCHGFRNPYDFDFDARGRIYVYDSDGERDVSLPWYRPTRVYRVEPGGDAGWVSASWKRPSSFFDMPELVGQLGRGSPTGVAACQNSGLGEDYDQAVFVGDWTFGRIGVAKRKPNSEEFQEVEIFAKPKGNFGFAITDIVFCHDGSMLVSTGGRGTEGSVYRISKVDALKQTEQKQGLKLPAAKPINEGILRQFSTTTDEAETVAAAIRNTRWESFSSGALEELIRVAREFDDREVSISIIQAMTESPFALNNLDVAKVNGTAGLIAELAKDAITDKRMLRALRHLIDSTSSIPDLNERLLSKTSPLHRLLIEPPHPSISDEARVKQIEQLATFMGDLEIEQQQIAIRAMQLLLGGCGGDRMFAGHVAARPLPLDEEANRTAASMMQTLLDRPETAFEAARLAGMLELNSTQLRSKVVQITVNEVDPVDQIHWLNCVANMRGSLSPESVATVAERLIRVRSSIESASLPVDRNWEPRMQQLAKQLFAESAIADAVTSHPEFGGPSNIWLFRALPQISQPAARASVAKFVDQNRNAVTASQLRTLTGDFQYDSLVRSFSDQPEFLDIVVQVIATKPTANDRKVLLRGIESTSAKTRKASAVSLRRINIATPTHDEIAAVLSAALRSGWSDPEISVKDQLVLLLQQWSGLESAYRPRQYRPSADLIKQQKSSLDALQQALSQNGLLPNDFANRSDVSTRISSIDFSAGDPKSGKYTFTKLQCGKCHLQGGQNSGPRLDGITARFSRDDIFQSIVAPNDIVPERYRATLIETADGDLVKGTIVYESTDGIMLATETGEIVRIDSQDIESRRVSKLSLMPSGLLDQASDAEIADLWAYLQSL
jgi:putative heme-binding domain-containing protein